MRRQIRILINGRTGHMAARVMKVQTTKYWLHMMPDWHRPMTSLTSSQRTSKTKPDQENQAQVVKITTDNPSTIPPAHQLPHLSQTQSHQLHHPDLPQPKLAKRNPQGRPSFHPSRLAD